MDSNFNLSDYVKALGKRLRKQFPDTLPSHSKTLDRISRAMGFHTFKLLKAELDNLNYDNLYTYGLRYQGILQDKMEIIMDNDDMTDEEKERFLECVDYFYRIRFRVEHAFLFGGHNPIQLLWEKDIERRPGYANEYTFPEVGSFNARAETYEILGDTRDGFQIYGFGDVEQVDKNIEKLIDYVTEKNPMLVIHINKVFLSENTGARLENHKRCILVHREGRSISLIFSAF